jgi:hypothetical protein
MSHAPAILAAMTSCLADATAAGLPCGVPTHSAAGLAEELGVDRLEVAVTLRAMWDAGRIERLPMGAIGYPVYRLVQAVPA